MNKVELIAKHIVDSDLDLKNLYQLNGKAFQEKNIEKIILNYGGKSIKLRDLFYIKYKKSKKRYISIKGSNLFYHNIGYEWQEDLLEVFGDVGSFLGSKMKSGILKINGSCQNFLGCNMVGGEILVKKNVKDYVGAADYGEKFGMTGGKIEIYGTAGSYLGYRMKGGLIKVKGGVSDFCANNLIAGTIIIESKIGKNFGIGMKRGTLILLESPGNFKGQFKNCGLQQLDFVQLINESLLDSTFFKQNQFLKFIGDRNNKGLGEILIKNKGC